MSDIGQTTVRMVRVPFNFHWPRGGKVSVVRELGEQSLDDTIAQAALAAGAAVQIDPPAPAPKAKPRRRKTRGKSNAADKGTGEAMGGGDFSDDGRPGDQPPADVAG